MRREGLLPSVAGHDPKPPGFMVKFSSKHGDIPHDAHGPIPPYLKVPPTVHDPLENRTRIDAMIQVGPLGPWMYLRPGENSNVGKTHHGIALNECVYSDDRTVGDMEVEVSQGCEAIWSAGGVNKRHQGWMDNKVSDALLWQWDDLALKIESLRRKKMAGSASYTAGTEPYGFVSQVRHVSGEISPEAKAISEFKPKVIQDTDSIVLPEKLPRCEKDLNFTIGYHANPASQ